MIADQKNAIQSKIQAQETILKLIEGFLGLFSLLVGLAFSTYQGSWLLMIPYVITATFFLYRSTKNKVTIVYKTKRHEDCYLGAKK